MLSLFDNEEINTIKYELSIKRSKLNNGNHLLEIDKISETYINDIEPDLVADQMATKAASALYPFHLIINLDNSVLGISNLSTIQARWINIKNDMRTEQTGETIEKYLKLLDKTMSNERTLLRSLRNDWFLNTYLNRIYFSYGENYSQQVLIEAPYIYDAKGVEYLVEQTIDRYLDTQGYIHVNMKGSCMDKRSKVDLMNGLNYPYQESNEQLKGDYSAKYIVEPKNNTINSFLLDCSLELNKTKKMILVASRISENELHPKNKTV